jgi:hydroxymethylpyrimidine kinase/phosphomethylpyrimidine kinase/thiamine-phosphate diphosphorylase
VWSISGADSGGGAGLAADQRAAHAFGAHLCPVVAAVTAQNSTAVAQVMPVTPQVLDAQLAALAADMPPAAIKVGLLGSAGNVHVVARWVDRLRARHPQRALPLVVDPVLGATTGKGFADADTLAALARHLLPRATLITPNAAEAARLAAALRIKLNPIDGNGSHLPALAAALHEAGAQAVCITGGDLPATATAQTQSPQKSLWALDWADTPQARGWLALPRIQTPHTHGTGCTFATSAAAALALGHPAADALVLAKMATAHALRHGWPAGQGAGPVGACAGFGTDPALMPTMSWGNDAEFENCLNQCRARTRAKALWGIYPIVDNAQRAAQMAAQGAKLVQLRIKTPQQPDADWHIALRQNIAQAHAACRAAGATLVVNDHWPLALQLAQTEGSADNLAVHLGQEDLLALSARQRAQLAASKLRLGISSHSLWELARARGLRPAYIACGPVWPTLTKAMPWKAQGLDNLAWWARMAGCPVVAIGGILQPAQATQAAQSAAAVCVLRGLDTSPRHTLAHWQTACAQGHGSAPRPRPPALPHAVLD